ncbi:hypothetical protein EHM92_04875 [bacterium]|nr:MAG: hypothetical protein EHM92_04875 [bacterium]
MRSVLGWTALAMVILAMALIIYADDIQIVESSAREIPTIYNIRFFGVKIIDGISIFLIGVVGAYLLFRERITVTSFHRQMGIIFLVYCYAGMVGFIYSFFYQYDYLIWLQDFQPVIYMAGFFLIVYHVIDTLPKWKLFVTALLLFMAAKNLLILYWTFTGIGRSFDGWAFRASQNSEFTYFPMMFFPFLLLVFKKCPRALKIPIIVVLAVYLFNSLVGIYRTVWVMIMLGSLYLLTQLDGKTRLKMLLYGTLSLALVINVVAIFFPRFLDLAWSFKFASIFEWSVYGDRSNATRTLEIMNVVNYVFSHFAFLQGMGLGAWWDDSARRLLPDFGSGFTFKRRFTTTHMLYFTQLLKLGLVAMFFFWRAIYKMFITVARYVRTMPWDRWEKSVLLGMNVGFLCALISSALFPRLFLIIGVNMALAASFMSLERKELGSATGHSEGGKA